METGESWDEWFFTFLLVQKSNKKKPRNPRLTEVIRAGIYNAIAGRRYVEH